MGEHTRPNTDGMRYTSPDGPYTHQFTVMKGVTHSMRPLVDAMRQIHIEAWLKETDLERVIALWQRLHYKGDSEP